MSHVSDLYSALTSLAAQADWQGIEQGAELRQLQREQTACARSLAEETARLQTWRVELLRATVAGAAFNPALVQFLKARQAASASRAEQLSTQCASLRARETAARDALAANRHRAEGLHAKARQEKVDANEQRVKLGHAVQDDLWTQRDWRNSHGE